MPWVFGADPHAYDPPNVDDFDSPFRLGAIDEVRISGERRVFTY